MEDAFPEGWGPDIPPEAQAFQSSVTVVAKLLPALHLTAEGTVLEVSILDDPHGHGHRDRPSHGTYSLAMMIGLKRDPSALQKPGGLIDVLGPSFEK